MIGTAWAAYLTGCWATIRCMKKALLVTAGSVIAWTTLFAEEVKTGTYYVIVEHTDERLAPKATGKSTNVIYKRQLVEVLEVNNGWARVSKYYDGTVEGAAGQVARWIATKDLSSKRPADEHAKSGEPEVTKLIADSDDFSKYRKAFITASQSLIDSKRCTLQDFKQVGGWMKSTNQASAPVYFTYCGGETRANRLYLNVKTGQVFQ